MVGVKQDEGCKGIPKEVRIDVSDEAKGMQVLPEIRSASPSGDAKRLSPTNLGVLR